MPSAISVSAISTRLRLLQRQQLVCGLQDGHPGTEASEDLRQLDPDCTATQHDQRFGRFLGLDRLPVGPVRGVGQPRHRRYRGDRSGGHDHPAPGDERLPVDRHLARSGDPGGPADEPATLGDQPVHRDLVVPVVRRLVPDPGGDRCVERLHVDLARHLADPAGLGEQGPGAKHHLGAHAAPVRALAADQLPLDPHDLEPRLSQLPRDVLAPGTEADHHDIRHGSLLPRVRPGRSSSVQEPHGDGRTSRPVWE